MQALDNSPFIERMEELRVNADYRDIRNCFEGAPIRLREIRMELTHLADFLSSLAIEFEVNEIVEGGGHRGERRPGDDASIRRGGRGHGRGTNV